MLPMIRCMGSRKGVLPWLLWALLLPAVVHLLRRVPVVCAIASVEHRCLSGSVEELKRIVEQIRPRGPWCVWWRGDSGFCREELMAWCEANRVETCWTSENERLKAEIAQEQKEAQARYKRPDARPGCSKSSSIRRGRAGVVRDGWWPSEHLEKERTAVRGDLLSKKHGQQQRCMKSTTVEEGTWRIA